MEQLWDERNRARVLVLSATFVALVAFVDRWTKPYVSLGFLYLFPIMLAAAYLPRWLITLLGTTCAILAEIFSSLPASLVRLGFETLGLVGCGLFVGEIVRRRRLILETQARLKVLVETSPAAIVTVDEHGSIEVANRSALEILAPRCGHLIGEPISAFLPDLHRAIRWEQAPQLRAALQCTGHRGNGQSFAASVWFSTYKEASRPKVAAIIAAVANEETTGKPAAMSRASNVPVLEVRQGSGLGERETAVLRLVVQGLPNKEISTQMKISESAVKNTVQQLFAKADVHSRSQLVRVAIEQYRNIL